MTPLNIVILVLKVLMDLISRVLIFFTFMIVHNNGKFSPMRTLTSFYIMVCIMFIFNVVFNERKNYCSIKYWLGKLKIKHGNDFRCSSFPDVLINSYSSTLRFEIRMSRV